MIKHSPDQCLYRATLTIYKHEKDSPEGLNWLNGSFRNIEIYNVSRGRIESVKDKILWLQEWQCCFVFQKSMNEYKKTKDFVYVFPMYGEKHGWFVVVMKIRSWAEV